MSIKAIQLIEETATQKKRLHTKGFINKHKGLFKNWEYMDGSIGEIFIDMHKEGWHLGSLMNNFAIAVSIAHYNMGFH